MPHNPLNFQAFALYKNGTDVSFLRALCLTIAHRAKTGHRHPDFQRFANVSTIYTPRKGCCLKNGHLTFTRFRRICAAMSNLANLAPQFTRENAAEMARRATAARIANAARAKAAREEAIRLTRAQPDDARNERVKKQIDALLDDMENETDVKERQSISRTISDLWKLVQPTAGVNKPGRNRRDTPSSQPIEAPAPAAEPSKQA